MKPFRSRSTVEQLADYLRDEMKSGTWGGTMPGVAKLSIALGVGTRTVVAAFEILKREGLLQGHGERKRNRVIVAPGKKPAGLRIRILLYEPRDIHVGYIVDLRHQLQEQGHSVSFAPKTATELNFDVDRVARMVKKSSGDAWIVQSGSRPILEWFATKSVPAFAMFGRQTNIPMASLALLKSPAITEALRHLEDLGHHRIVLMTREERRKPIPGLMERRFLIELKRRGIEVSTYNLPDWGNDKQGFHQCLDSMFQYTPPTALLLSEPSLYFATQQFLTKKGITAPRDISTIALDDHSAFEWFDPEVSVIRSDTRRWVPRIVKWAENVAKGRADERETLIKSKFIKGGTIGPVPLTA